MNQNRLYAIAIVLVSLLLLSGIAHAQNVEELRQNMDDAEDVVADAKDDHDDATYHLNKQIENFVRLHGHLAGIDHSGPGASRPRALYMAIAKIATVVLDTNHLTSAMEEQLAAIETQRGICNDIWADVLLARTAYEDAVDAFNAAVSPEEQVTTVEAPQPSEVSYLYLCPGPCSTPFETQVLATTSHQVFCQDEPHLTTGFSYY